MPTGFLLRTAGLASFAIALSTPWQFESDLIGFVAELIEPGAGSVAVASADRPAPGGSGATPVVEAPASKLEPESARTRWTAEVVIIAPRAEERPVRILFCSRSCAAMRARPVEFLVRRRNPCRQTVAASRPPYWPRRHRLVAGVIRTPPDRPRHWHRPGRVRRKSRQRRRHRMARPWAWPDRSRPVSRPWREASPLLASLRLRRALPTRRRARRPSRPASARGSSGRSSATAGSCAAPGRRDTPHPVRVRRAANNCA
jgi:hypothetical protein